MLDGKRILVENSPGIGDLIMLTPVLREIKNKYPKCILTVASKNRNSLIAIERIPYVDAVCPLENKFSDTLRASLSIAKQDYIILCEYRPCVMLWARFCGVKHRTGNCKKKYYYSGLMTHPLPRSNEEHFGQYKTDFLAEVLSVGIDEEINIYDYQCDVSLPTEAEKQSFHERLRQQGCDNDKYVVLSPFANSEVSLRMDTVSVILQFLANHGYATVITGPKNDALTAWLASHDTKSAYNLCGMTTLMEMIAGVSDAAALLAVESGPMHIGAALKKPNISFFTSGKKATWKPRLHCHDISLNLDCAQPCIVPEQGKASCPHKKCADFPTAYVQESLDEAMHDYGLI